MQSQHENDKSIQSGGSAYSKNSGSLSINSGLAGLNMQRGSVAVILQQKTTLEKI